ncbi:MAG: GGDEF domain-containing protein [Clostridia bacterium]|nr:GGDEF domain-containing protein [Clostridia bacterium]
MSEFALYYIEANVICIIVFAILLIHNHFNLDRQEKQIKYDHALTMFMLYFAVDCFWAAIEAELLPKTRFTVAANDFLIYILMGATIYYWLDYVMAYVQVPHRNRPINRFAVIFPFLVSTVVLVLQYIFAPYTLISEARETMPGFSVYMVVVPDIYLVAILFYTIRKAKGEENPLEKQKYIFIGVFPLVVMVGGLIETLFFPHLPIYCFTCLILMLVFYIQAIEIRVSMDPLTHLNNRGQLMRYISQKSNLHPEGRQTYVVMMDIDDFKAINDTYGHAEGDKALVTIANSLKKAVNRYGIPAFLGRYGGDEFILIAHPEIKEEIDQLIRVTREEIRQECADSGIPYLLFVSAGYDELKENQDSVQSCIQRADEKLYQDKKIRKLRAKQAMAR